MEQENTIVQIEKENHQMLIKNFAVLNISPHLYCNYKVEGGVGLGDIVVEIPRARRQRLQTETQ